MTTAIEDGELNTELQELYLEAKQWIADLDFLDSELAFLNKLTANMAAKAEKKGEIEKLTGIEKTYLSLKEEMNAYLRQLEPLITQKKEDFDLGLIETYTHLKWRLDEVLHSCQTVKNSVFDHSKHGLAEGNAS
ncbi:hypothetical protein [Mucilaginibacter gotjawali]|uniref:Chromosome segregation ATPase n=1 Tax=Mucilaginibacter gotjawali TaxID=1550579 RepID=A0A839SC44_9SPHI|nr:hypothetical protein [Mucilaginibacter gotjawali]MBB3054480.1 chromosome segregation ATPase [Mucilaginibacter gotjawali]